MTKIEINEVKNRFLPIPESVAQGLEPEPKISDIGILASTDPVAIDRASVDLVKNTSEIGTEEWVNQLNNLKGENTIRVAESHGIGTQKYNLTLVEDDKIREKNKTDLVIIIIGLVLGFVILVTLLVVFIIRNRNKSKGKDDFLIPQKMNE